MLLFYFSKEVRCILEPIVEPQTGWIILKELAE